MVTVRKDIPTLQVVTASTTRQRGPTIAGPPVVNLTVQADDRLLLTVAEAARRLEIGRSLFYELLAAGEIESIHVGRLRRVPADALAAYVARRRPSGPDPAA
jgi:excisionase family DNA binding protein